MWGWTVVRADLVLYLETIVHHIELKEDTLIVGSLPLGCLFGPWNHLDQISSPGNVHLPRCVDVVGYFGQPGLSQRLESAQTIYESASRGFPTPLDPQATKFRPCLLYPVPRSRANSKTRLASKTGLRTNRHLSRRTQTITIRPFFQLDRHVRAFSVHRSAGEARPDYFLP